MVMVFQNYSPRQHTEDVAVVGEALWARLVAEVETVAKKGHQNRAAIPQLFRSLKSAE